MGFFRTITQLQRRPESERRVVLWISTTSLMAVILIVWVTARGGLIPVAGPERDQADIATAISPLDSIKQVARVIADDISRGYAVVIGSLGDESPMTNDPVVEGTGGEEAILRETVLMPDRSLVPTSTEQVTENLNDSTGRESR